MAKPALKAALLSPQRPLGEHPLLVAGSSLGTSSILWNRAAFLLGKDYDVIAWDLPGHGVSPAAAEAFDVAALADAVVDLVDSITPGESFHYAGVSLGGATGLQLGIKHGDRLRSLSVQNSGAKIGTSEAWLERAETVRSQGTPVMIQGSAQRWATNQKLAIEPLEIPVLAIGAREFYGEHVGEQMRKVANNVQVHVWDDCGHSLALEQPDRLAATLRSFIA